MRVKDLKIWIGIIAMVALLGWVGYLDQAARENMSGLPSSVVQKGVVARWR